MASFYLPDCNKSTNFLPEEESRHAVKSLRLRDGDEIGILNGQGSVFIAEISDVSKKKVTIKINSEQIFDEPDKLLTIAISPLKFPDRFEFFIEKATEMGIHRIVPIKCHRTEKKNINRKRLERIMISAIKQSKNKYLPVLDDLTDLGEYIAKEGAETRIIAHCDTGIESNLLHKKMGKNISVLIGPEGGFTEEEVQLATASSYNPISLGNNILRAESAGISVCAYIHLSNNE